MRRMGRRIENWKAHAVSGNTALYTTIVDAGLRIGDRYDLERQRVDKRRAIGCGSRPTPHRTESWVTIRTAMQVESKRLNVRSEEEP